MLHTKNQLVIYKSLMDDPIICLYHNLINEKDKEKINFSYYELVRCLIEEKKSFRVYLFEQMMASVNPILEKLCHSNYVASDLDYACLKNDLLVINHMIHHNLDQVLEKVDNQHNLLEIALSTNEFSKALEAYNSYFETIDDKPIFHQQCDEFIEILRLFGTGQYANHFAFYLDDHNGLVPIERYEPLDWNHIYDYQMQKDLLYKNTNALVGGKPFHHALLVGASGTGKSSSVKAVVELFRDKKLRMIQLYKGQLKKLPKLLESLSDSVFKFVLYIDDLSFEVNEDEYKFLKSFIEGGIANDASNVAFYVTSNRRHLIKEVRSEREGGDIHLQDFIQEMTSLSGRFGLNLTFESLTQKAYYQMVRQMVEDEGLKVDLETLDIEAKRWSLRHGGGMSGRIANQFVKHLQMI